MASYWETVNIMKPSTLTAKLPEVAIIRHADYLCPIFQALARFVSNILHADYLCLIFDALSICVQYLTRELCLCPIRSPPT